MKQSLSIALACVALTTTHIKSMTSAEAKTKHAEAALQEKTRLTICAQIWCKNFGGPIYKNISAPQNATVGQLRTHLANQLQNPEGCRPRCGGIKRCANASFKNAVDNAGSPIIAKIRDNEIWDDNDTLVTALKRNNHTSTTILIFTLKEPEL